MTITTNVPAPILGPTGFITPFTSDILAGVQEDLNAAFGGNLNPSLTTPQGQIASSEAAIIADCYSNIVSVFNGVDPAFSEGRMQDGIGRIYFLSRIPAQATIVTCQCLGATGITIPAGSTAQDQGGNIYVSIESGTIPLSGTIDITFQCTVSGPISCPSNFLTKIVSTIPGWDSISNTSSGVTGYNVESRASFATRMSQSVAINANGIMPAILGEVLAVTNVSDAFAVQNPLPVNSGAIVTGSISGTTFTVSAVASGKIVIGQMLIGSGIISGTYVSDIGSGTGGVGTYSVNYSQSVSSEQINCEVAGVTMLPHSVYVSVFGGQETDIAQAIFNKINAGCVMNGNTSVIIYDTQSGYNPPYPSYLINFEIPTATPILFNVQMQNNRSVPSNATTLIQNAIIRSFDGTDGGARARIGSTIFSSRFYANIALLGTWAVILNIQLGIDAASQSSVLMRADQIPTISTGNISVSFI